MKFACKNCGQHYQVEEIDYEYYKSNDFNCFNCQKNIDMQTIFLYKENIDAFITKNKKFIGYEFELLNLFQEFESYCFNKIIEDVKKYNSSCKVTSNIYPYLINDLLRIFKSKKHLIKNSINDFIIECKNSFVWNQYYASYSLDENEAAIIITNNYEYVCKKAVEEILDSFIEDIQRRVKRQKKIISNDCANILYSILYNHKYFKDCYEEYFKNRFLDDFVFQYPIGYLDAYSWVSRYNNHLTKPSFQIGLYFICNIFDTKLCMNWLSERGLINNI